MAWGTAASQPATYGDLANAHSISLISTELSFNGGLNDYPRIHTSGVTISGSVGQHLWLCYVSTTDTPISGTALDVAIDCGAIIA